MAVPKRLLLVLWLLSGTVSAGVVRPDLPGRTLADGRVLQAVPRPGLARVEQTIVEALQRQRRVVADWLARGRPGRGRLALAYGNLGMLYHAHDIYRPAQVAYENALALDSGVDSGAFRWCYYLGYLLQQTGQLDAAARRLHQALERRPADAPTILRLADVELERDRPARAVELYQQLLKEPALADAARYGLGRARLVQRDFAAARTALETALDHHPQASELEYPLAMALRGLGEVATARQHLARRGSQRVPRPDPLVTELKGLASGARTHFFRAVQEVKWGRYPEAAREFSQGLALNPDNALARISLARSRFLAGDRKGARKALEETLHRAPDNALAHFLLGVLLDDVGDARSAEAEYRRALDRDPSQAGASFYLGRRALARGDWRRAARRFAAAVAADPDNLPALEGECLARWRVGGDGSESIRRLRVALRDHPDDASLAALLARLLLALPTPGPQELDEALALAKRGYAKQPGPAQSETLAMAYARSGRWREAVTQQELALAQWTLFGAFERLSVAEGRLRAYQEERFPVPVWADEELRMRLGPATAQGLFRHYPMRRAY